MWGRGISMRYSYDPTMAMVTPAYRLHGGLLSMGPQDGSRIFVI